MPEPYVYSQPADASAIGTNLAHAMAVPRCRCTLFPFTGQLQPAPWLDDLTWHFPTWAVRSRPFDYTVDEADIPIPPPPPPYSLPERQRFDLYLRPAPPAVRHPFPARWSA